MKKLAQGCADMWADFYRAEEKARSRARHPAGKCPLDTASDFHDEVAAIDLQTGRVLPRSIPGSDLHQPPMPRIYEASLTETVLVTVAGVIAVVGVLILVIRTVLAVAGVA